MLIAGILSAHLALAAAGAEPAQARWAVPPALQRGGWQTRCRRGTDGFAANCEANRLAGGFWYRIVVGDGQVTYQVRHRGCSTDPISFPREDIVGLPPAQRHAQAVSAFDIATARLRRQCPSLPPAERDFTIIPDLAVVGDEVLRRR